MKMVAGRIFDIKEFAVYDGPGVRVTYFLQGCPLKCEWCHNPEGQSWTGGRKISSEKVIADIKKYQDIWGNCNGGVTFSGGEPMCQPDFLIEILKGTEGISRVIETSAAVTGEIFRKISCLAEFLYIDLKLCDEEQHIRYTGVSNKEIKNNIRWLAETDIPFVIRIPMIPGVSDTEENYRLSAEFISGLRRKTAVELLPYNTLTKAKYDAIRRKYNISFDPGRPLNRDLKAFEIRGIPCRIL